MSLSAAGSAVYDAIVYFHKKALRAVLCVLNCLHATVAAVGSNTLW